MPPTHIPSTITEEQRDQVFALLDQVDEILGPLVTLSLQERRFMPKLGIRFFPFVLKCVTLINNHPELLSAYDNGDHIRQNFLATNLFSQIESRVGVTQSKVSNMRISSGSEAVGACRRFYNMLKIGGKLVPGCDTFIDDLAEAYPSRRKSVLPEDESADSEQVDNEPMGGIPSTENDL